MRQRSRLVAAAIVLVGFSAVVLTACGTKDVFSKPDLTICVYDKEDGKLIKQLPPGADQSEVEDDAVVVEIPTSNRFYYISPDGSVKDPGAPNYVTGRDASYKDMQMVVQTRFRFDVNKACKWFDQHGRRNADGNGSLGFNVRGDASQGWARWLNENMASAMQTVGEPLIFDYTWPHHEYNYPVNADDNGIVPSGQEAGVLTRAAMQVEFGALLSANLRESLGDDYFCGIDYDPAKPDVCPPIKVDIYSVKLVDQKPVEDRKAVEALREEARINAEKAILIGDNAQSEIDQRQAQSDKDVQIRAIDNAEAIQKEKERQALLIEQRATNELEAQQAAADDLAVCSQAAQLNGGTITPDECAKILLALQGLSPNVPGGTVNVN